MGWTRAPACVSPSLSPYLNTTNEAMSNDQQTPSEQPQDTADMQTMRDILREEIENPWGLPPLPSEPTKDEPGV